MQIQVHSVRFDADKKLIAFIEEKVEKLTLFSDNIIGADIYLRVDKGESIENKVSEIKLLVPGKDLFAKKTSKSFEAAVDDAVEALRRQIKKYKEKQRVS